MARRRSRGLDFQQRLDTSRWAEGLLMKALNAAGLLCVRSGISEARLADAVLEIDEALKVPDLLVFEPGSVSRAERVLLAGTDLPSQPPTVYARGGRFHFACQKALAAIEVEFSPYKAKEMKGRHWQKRTPEQLARRPPRVATRPTAPNIWVKEEDLARLQAWERDFGVPIVVAHLFDQEGFAVRFSEVTGFDRRYRENPNDRIRLQLSTGFFKFVQRFSRVDAEGAAEEKTVLVVAPCAATKVGDIKRVRVDAQLGVSASKKYVAHVLFKAGRLQVDEGFLTLVRETRRP